METFPKLTPTPHPPPPCSLNASHKFIFPAGPGDPWESSSVPVLLITPLRPRCSQNPTWSGSTGHRCHLCWILLFQTALRHSIGLISGLSSRAFPLVLTEVIPSSLGGARPGKRHLLQQWFWKSFIITANILNVHHFLSSNSNCGKSSWRHIIQVDQSIAHSSKNWRQLYNH